MMNRKNATDSKSTFHPIVTCWVMISLRCTLPASSNTHTVLIPIAISYDTICALARRPPRSAYLLFELHPASVRPYTPRELIAKVKRNPTGRSATTMSMRPHGVGSGDAKGITAQVSMAGTKASAGASMNSTLCASAGYVSSFMKFLTPSAST